MFANRRGGSRARAAARHRAGRFAAIGGWGIFPSVKASFWNGVALAVGVLVLAVLGPVLVRELRTLPHPRALAARSAARIVTLEVGGMTCSGCAARVREELEAVPGVSSVAVRLGAQRALIVCDRAVADSALVAAVHRAGPGFTAARAGDGL